MSSTRVGLLDAVDAGRDLDELVEFLVNHGADIPANLTALVTGVRQTVRQLVDRGAVRLIECASEQVAEELARSPKLRRLCRRVGAHHLAVELDKVPAFKEALRREGRVVQGLRAG